MRQIHSYAGFTLVELLVSLVVAAIFGTMLVTYMHGVFIRGGEPVRAVGNVHQLALAMDRITAYYNSQIHLSRTSSGEDALDALVEYLADQYSGGEYEALWYSGPSFEGPGNDGARADGEAFLKVTLSPAGVVGSLTSVFWSGD